MSCDKRVRQISLMLSGSLGEDETEKLDAHLERCGACRAELVLQRGIEKALRVEAHSGLSADFTEKVGARALSLSSEMRSPRPWPVLVPPLATAAAAVALFFVGMNLAGGTSPSFGQLVGGLLKPLVWVSGALDGLLGGAAQRASSFDPQASGTVGLAAAAVAGAISAYWGLRRFLVYLR